MIAYLQQHQGDVWQLFLLHMQICGEALGIALLIALPLGILISRYHALYVPIIGLFGAIYTIPSLALFAMLVPFTGLTTTTSEIALVSYTLLILIRNVVSGLDGARLDQVGVVADPVPPDPRVGQRHDGRPLDHGSTL